MQAWRDKVRGAGAEARAQRAGGHPHASEVVWRQPHGQAGDIRST